MKREDIIRMAREAGWGNLVSMPYVEALERFAALVAAAEREACAQVCDDLHDTFYDEDNSGECAAAIRARGQA